MPSKAPASLRIFCICGQKMRVAEDMFGRNGKCVACRQKIRIPRRTELDPGLRELHLKDHPEFLRKTRRMPVDWSGIATPSDEDPDIGDARERLSTVPIDVLDPLQVIVSLERQLRRRLEALDDLATTGSVADERAQLKRHQIDLENARNALEDHLRQRLMEVAIELTNTNEQLSSTDLAVRVGEIDYIAYVRRVTKLRRRRDLLERRQINLRGWLVLRDPGVAGGAIEDPGFQRIPKPDATIQLPPEPELEGDAVPYYIQRLHDIFHDRERAQHRLDTIDRKEAKSLREACQGELNRIAMAIDYYRDRLDRAILDLEADRQAIHAQLELLRGRLQIGEIRREHFDTNERALQEERQRLRKQELLAREAVQARNARDLPAPRGGTIVQWTRSMKRLTFGTDAWLAWGGSIALLFAIVLPAVGGLSPIALYQQSGSETPWVHWGITGPILAAFLFTTAALVPIREVRGILLCAIWQVLSIATAVFLQALWESPARAGILLRDAGLASPALTIHIAALVVFLTAAGLCLQPVRGLRFGVLAAALLAVLGIGIVTSTGGAAPIPPPAPPFEVTTEPPAQPVPTLPAEVDLTPPAPVTIPVPEEATVEDTAPEEVTEEAAEETPPIRIGYELIGNEYEAEWTGYVAGEGGVEPRFLIQVHAPGNGGSDRLWCQVGDPVHNGWSVSEFDPTRQTLTLRADEEVLVIRRGERMALPN